MSQFVVRCMVAESKEPALAIEVIALVRRLCLIPAGRFFRIDNRESPIDPTFSLAGRSVRSVRRLVQHWPDIYARRLGIPLIPSVPRDVSWLRMDADEMSWLASPSASGAEDQESIWEMIELTTAAELAVEGGILKHCVASYVSLCRSGRTSIWSLRCRTDRQSRRRVTIEVCPRKRKVRFVGGMRNRRPTEIEKTQIRHWADSQRIQVKCRAMG